MDRNRGSLVWMDLEMTGLNPLTDKIIEMAVLITDSELEVVAKGPELVIHQSDSILNTMDQWNTSHHTSSGLVDKVRASLINEHDAELQIIDFLKQYVDERHSPLCGNSICQDRRFIAQYMPQIDNYLHYRNVDVSSVKELVHRWYPGFKAYKKDKAHTALADITESIDELKYYRSRLFVKDF